MKRKQDTTSVFSIGIIHVYARKRYYMKMWKTQIAYGFRLWSDGDKRRSIALDTKLLKLDNRKTCSKIRQLRARSFFFHLSYESSFFPFFTIQKLNGGCLKVGKLLMSYGWFILALSLSQTMFAFNLIVFPIKLNYFRRLVINIAYVFYSWPSDFIMIISYQIEWNWWSINVE